MGLERTRLWGIGRCYKQDRLRYANRITIGNAGGGEQAWT